MFWDRVKRFIGILANPERSFRDLGKRTFEDVLEDYMKVLLFSGFLAALSSFLYQFAVAFYLAFVKKVNINFMNLLNYSAGTSTSMFFFYLFVGTVAVAVLAGLIKPFAGGLKFTRVVSVVLFSLAPYLIFGWIYLQAGIGLLMWCAFLLIVGLVVQKAEAKAAPRKKKQSS